MTAINHSQLHALLALLVERGQMTPIAVERIQSFMYGENVVVLRLSQDEYLEAVEAAQILQELEITDLTHFTGLVKSEAALRGEEI